MATQDEQFVEIQCPHCNGNIIVFRDEIACAIFRHGIYKANGMQVPPHAPKQTCDRLRETDQVHGCCQPFRLNRSTLKAEPCDYI